MKKRYFTRIHDQTWARLHKIEAYTKQECKCHYCKEPMSVKTSTADHMLPRSRGGTTHAKNIVASCSACNNLKSSMTDKEFMKLISSPQILRNWSNEFLLAWSRRRIWIKTNSVVKNIQKLAS